MPFSQISQSLFLNLLSSHLSIQWIGEVRVKVAQQTPSHSHLTPIRIPTEHDVKHKILIQLNF